MQHTDRYTDDATQSVEHQRVVLDLSRGAVCVLVADNAEVFERSLVASREVVVDVHPAPTNGREPLLTLEDECEQLLTGDTGFDISQDTGLMRDDDFGMGVEQRAYEGRPAVRISNEEYKVLNVTKCPTIPHALDRGASEVQRHSGTSARELPGRRIRRRWVRRCFGSCRIVQVVQRLRTSASARADAHDNSTAESHRRSFDHLTDGGESTGSATGAGGTGSVPCVAGDSMHPVGNYAATTRLGSNRPRREV